jgi:hypothetical protein
LRNVSFKEGSTISSSPYPDSLIVTFTFTDGDSDFGFNRDNEAHYLPPYHFANFFLKNTGEPVTSDKIVNYEIGADEVIRYSDRQYPPYDTLPEMNDGACYYYFQMEPTGSHIYFTLNEDHYNIFVDFFYEDVNGGFIEYDWFKQFCVSFNGRVSDRAGDDGPFTITMANSKRGELTYRMSSHGFKAIFGDKRIKLRIYIKDLALHNSNVIETEPFLLE